MLVFNVRDKVCIAVYLDDKNTLMRVIFRVWVSDIIIPTTHYNKPSSSYYAATLPEGKLQVKNKVTV
jgi:hypothetical protein